MSDAKVDEPRFLMLLVTFILLALVMLFLNTRIASQVAASVTTATEMQMLSQRLARGTSLAVQGNAAAFPDVKDSRDRFRSDLDALSKGGSVKGMLVGRVGNREGFNASDAAEAAEIAAELDALRQEAAPQPQLDDSETVAERIAEADEASRAVGARLVAIPSPVAAERPPEPAEQQHGAVALRSRTYDAAATARD